MKINKILDAILTLSIVAFFALSIVQIWIDAEQTMIIVKIILTSLIVALFCAMAKMIRQ